MRRSWGMICLYVWLIIYGAVVALSLSFEWQRYVMGGLLIVAGFLLLIGKD